jgi:Holliday junction resolvasome RuvABC endonuclease subunit
LKRGESPGMRFLRCRSWLNEMWKLLDGQIDVIVYEQAHHRGGAATAVCVGLITEVLAFAAEHNIELMPVHTATLKKFATGSGRANKKDMVKAAQNRGWSPQDHNEADAQLLLEYGLNELKC